MAAAASLEDVCEWCFDTRPLKIVGRCKHRFCVECLTITLESQEGDVFACPTCKVDCPRPWDGVKGMVDFTGQDCALEEVGILLGIERRTGDKVKGVQRRGTVPDETTIAKQTGRNRGVKKTPDVAAIAMDVKCTICFHRKKDVPAVNLCVECDHLHICEECTEVHAHNKATHGHVVVRLRSERKKREPTCGRHNALLSSYCHDCGEAVCMVCVMLEHGDHTLEKFADIVDTKVERLKGILEKKQKRLQELQDIKSDLTLLKVVAPIVSRQETLIKEIEDHAEKCIQKIVQWKEGLKKQVKEEYNVVQDIAVSLENVGEMVCELEEPVERAEGLLAETDYHPAYLDQLTVLEHDLDDSLYDEEWTIDGTIDGEGCREQLTDVHSKHPIFIPDAQATSFGRLGRRFKTNTKSEKIFQIFAFKMPVHSKDMFIPTIANLGQKFAVAHPTKYEQPSQAINIYDFSGNLERTVRHLDNQVYEMSSTPDGKIAELSGQGGARTDHESISLCVTPLHQYVLLGENQHGQRFITVKDRAGVVAHKYMIDEEIDNVKNANRITSGGRFIFVMGDHTVVAYEIKETGIQRFKTCIQCTNKTQLTDISATIWDRIFLTYVHNDSLWLEKWEMNDYREHEWSRRAYAFLNKKVTGTEKEARVSAKDGHVVVSYGKTVRVFLADFFFNTFID